MGFAKYREDDLKIYDERMYYRNGSFLPSVQSSYTQTASKIEYKCFCPFCKCGFMLQRDLISHILRTHGGIHEFIYLNNRRLYDAEAEVRQVYSLKLYSFREEPREIHILDGLGVDFSFRTKNEKYEYDIQSILQAKLYSEIRITNIDNPVLIKQKLDISIVSVDKILSGKYLSFLFDEQISEELLSPEGCLTYIKMLIHEGSDTDPFIERIGYMGFDKTRELEEIYYYHFLYTGSSVGIEGKIIPEVSTALLKILKGEYSSAEKYLSEFKGRSNDKNGCLMILSLLTNDKLGVDYQSERYNAYGVIGILEKVLKAFSDYEYKGLLPLEKEIDELKLFSGYPLISALVELYGSIGENREISYESYSLLRGLTPFVAIQYCYTIESDDAKEKILKSMVKVHKDSLLIKDYAFHSDYAWMKRRIFVSDGDLYRKAVYAQNEKGRNFSRSYLDSFPYDDQITITPLGGEKKISASCFVISYNGYNIMLDCGINPAIYGDEAYPKLDQWDREIDTIVVSHAHIDHSGGVPKAHAMWPNANIIATSPTKIFLKYLYADMAKVKNGITDEFELENVNIEKDIMLDTLNSMNPVEYGEWINLGGNIKIRFHTAGHIIGAAIVELNIAGKCILYTGDYCDYNQTLAGNFNLQSLPHDVDYLITEATYMRQEQVDWDKQLANFKKAIRDAINGDKGILLPAAAVGRSQELVCILGEMRLNGEIPESIPLYIAGMAIPATTQIVPLMNERYEVIIGLFNEFDGVNYPEDNAIVVASSGTMTKGSASYKIQRNWDYYGNRYAVLTNGVFEDVNDDGSIGYYGQVQRVPLATHVDMKGILALIDYVSPKVISFVHRASSLESDIRPLVSRCEKMFAGDIMYRELRENVKEKIFDIYSWFMEGEAGGE